MTEIFDLGLKVFGLHIWIITYVIFYWVWTGNLLDSDLYLYLLNTLLVLDLELGILGVGLRIWITIIKFYWIWTWKYLQAVI